MSLSATRRSALVAAGVPVASIVANVASYALLLAAAHLMTKAAYGTLSSLLSLLLIATIPMLALQTVAARRTATRAGSTGVVRGTVIVGVASAAGLAVIAPALGSFLHLPSVAGVLLVALTVPPLAVLGTAMGVAQGNRDFGRLAVLILASTGGRSLGGLIGLLIGRTTTTTMAGALIGAVVATLAIITHGGQPVAHARAVRDRTRAGVVGETWHAAHAHGSFLLLTSLDVLLARHVLSAEKAGVYAVGAVVTRAALWLPQSVVVLMFASLAESHRHQLTARRASAVVAGIGAVLVASTAALGPLVIAVVGGDKYRQLNTIAWLFALLGALLALVQLAVLAGLAQRRVGRTALIWLTVAADVVLVLTTSTKNGVSGLVVTLVCVAGAAAVGALWLTVRQLTPGAGHGPGVNVGSSPGPNAEPTPTATG